MGKKKEYNEVEFQEDIVVKGETVMDGGLSADDVVATTDVTAGDDVIAADDITSTAGDITATAGNIIATAGDITATAGDVVATAGDIYATAGNVYVTAGNVYATAGDIYATAGDVYATAGDVFATAGDIYASAGDITATLGDVIAGTNVWARNGYVRAGGGIQDDKMFFCDDFLEVDGGTFGVYSANHWTPASGGAGTAVITAGAGGLAVLATGAVATDSTLSFTTANFNDLYNPSIEFRFRIPIVMGAGDYVRMGFYTGAADYVWLTLNQTLVEPTHFYLESNSSAGAYSTDTTVVNNIANFFKCRIDITYGAGDTSTYRCYIDDTEVLPGAHQTLDNTATLVPYFTVVNAVGADKQLFLDYVKIWQTRA